VRPRAPSRKPRRARGNPSRPAARSGIRGTREIGQRLLPWGTTGSSIALVADRFTRGEAAPRADVRRALYAVRTLRTRYTDADLRAIERALAARVETVRENPCGCALVRRPNPKPRSRVARRTRSTTRRRAKR